MFKSIIITATIALSLVGCINHSDTVTTIQTDDFGYTESIEVDDASCDSDMDCVEKFGCVGIYAPNDTVVDYACGNGDY
jgi:TPP-dependent indolepyruvate ferredoxin oxidoreductase alpha subunit